MNSEFRVEGPAGNDHVESAVALANAIIQMPEFYERIARKAEPFDRRWTSPGATPEVIAMLLRSASVEVRIRMAKARRKVLGWTYFNQPGIVYLNSRRLDRTRTSIVATLIHEWVHCVDGISHHDFHHGDNSSRGKDNSAPYWIDTLAAEMASAFFGEDLAHSLAVAHALTEGDELLEGLQVAEVARLSDAT
jgi:hypothetical protein